LSLLHDPIRADCFLLADAVQASEGKLFVLGGGWNLISIPSLPMTHPSMGLAIRLLIPWDETNRPLKFEVRIEDPDGIQVMEEPAVIELTVGRPPDLPWGVEQAVPLGITIRNAKLTKSGPHTLILAFPEEQRELARTRFDVISRNQAAPPALD
jgi:Family of unknown function (DUF6941)